MELVNHANKKNEIRFQRRLARHARDCRWIPLGRTCPSSCRKTGAGGPVLHPARGRSHSAKTVLPRRGLIGLSRRSNPNVLAPWSYSTSQTRLYRRARRPAQRPRENKLVDALMVSTKSAAEPERKETGMFLTSRRGIAPCHRGAQGAASQRGPERSGRTQRQPGPRDTGSGRLAWSRARRNRRR